MVFMIDDVASGVCQHFLFGGAAEAHSGIYVFCSFLSCSLWKAQLLKVDRYAFRIPKPRHIAPSLSFSFFLKTQFLTRSKHNKHNIAIVELQEPHP